MAGPKALGSVSWGALFLTLLCALPIGGQLLRPTERSDRVLEELERLQAFEILDTIPTGQRLGLARTLRMAMESDGGQPQDRTSAMAALVSIPDLTAALELSFGWVDANGREVQPNGLGEIDAMIATLAQARGGRILDDGSNWTVEPALGWRSGEWSFQARGRIRWLSGSSHDPEEGRVQELWVEGPLGPLYFSVGRAPVMWGLSFVGAPVFSGRSRALDHVGIATDGTFRFPWIFRQLGPSRFSVSVVRLDGTRAVPHSFLVGHRLSLRPTRNLEVGISMLIQSGGEGGPEASFFQRVLDYLVLVEPLTADLSAEISNKLAGLDVAWMVPGTRGSRAYLSIAFDDFGKAYQLDRVFGQDASYILGISIPRLEADGMIGLKAEYHETGVRFYRHGQFPSGVTMDRIVLGDGLGPDGRGVYLAMAIRPNASNRLVVQVAREERSNDFYHVKGEFFLSKVIDRPEEKRTRLLADWERSWPDRNFGVVARAGYEHVSNFAFDQATVRHGALSEIRAVLWLH